MNPSRIAIAEQARASFKPIPKVEDPFDDPHPYNAHNPLAVQEAVWQVARGQAWPAPPNGSRDVPMWLKS